MQSTVNLMRGASGGCTRGQPKCTREPLIELDTGGFTLDSAFEADDGLIVIEVR